MLRNDDKVIKKAFELGFWGVDHSLYSKPERKLQASFDARHEEDLKFMSKSIEDGLTRFRTEFGFSSVSFIPNNYIWPKILDPILIENGVKYMQGMKLHAHNWPIHEKKRRYSIKSSGKRNHSGLIDLLRQ